MNLVRCRCRDSHTSMPMPASQPGCSFRHDYAAHAHAHALHCTALPRELGPLFASRLTVVLGRANVIGHVPFIHHSSPPVSSQFSSRLPWDLQLLAQHGSARSSIGTKLTLDIHQPKAQPVPRSPAKPALQAPTFARRNRTTVVAISVVSETLGSGLVGALSPASVSLWQDIVIGQTHGLAYRAHRHPGQPRPSRTWLGTRPLPS